MLSIIFVDTNENFIKCVKKVFEGTEGVTAISMRIEEVNRDDTAFVSPANSFLFMDGGIDNELRKMFPGIEANIRGRLKNIGKKNILGRSYLPIGSALLTLTNDAANNVLISAPTMLLPQRVSETRNAYYSFHASLMTIKEYNKNTPKKIHKIVVPALCCGWGQMEPVEAASQMFDAYNDFKCGRTFPYTFETSVEGVLCSYEHPLQEQPHVYANTEWFYINPKEI
jgi:O-acetyl-ADP-ribose deacetylase (regulator of RNase III)